MIKLKSLVIWSKRDDIREISFNTEGITVLIGDSKVGKTTVISIIDYCLASSGCDIPAGLIRRCTSWFGIVLLKDNMELLIARKSPGNKNNSKDMYYDYLDGGIIPKKITSNMTRKDVRDKLNEIFGLTNLNINENIYEQEYIPSFRDTVGLNFYPQNLLTNKDDYFYKQSKDVHGKNFKLMFPYIMGISNMEEVLLKQKIKDIERHIHFLERKKERDIKTVESWEIEIDEKILHCIRLGLINIAEIPDDFHEKIQLLRVSKEVIKSEKITITKNSLHNLNKKVFDVEERVSKLYSELYQDNEKMKQLNACKKEINNLENINIENGETRKISTWLIRDERLLSNIVQNDDSYAKMIYGQMLNTLRNEEKNCEFYDSLKSSIDRDFLMCQRSIENKTNEIKMLEKVLKDYRKNDEKYRENYSLLKELYAFSGELDNYIKIYETLANSSSIDSKIAELNLEKEKYEGILESKAKKDNDIEDIESYLNGTLETFVDTLNVESKDKVWFDYKNIEFRFNLNNSKTGVPLSKVGSGANHVQYHIAMAMILQIFIQDKVENRCTLDFLVFDQPSEVYFPTDTDINKYNNEEQSQLDKENDADSLHQLFYTIAKTQKNSCPNLQLIILEHADDEYWKDKAGNFYTDNIKIIDWKKENKKLIPENWLACNQED